MTINFNEGKLRVGDGNYLETIKEEDFWLTVLTIIDMTNGGDMLSANSLKVLAYLLSKPIKTHLFVTRNKDNQYVKEEILKAKSKETGNNMFTAVKSELLEKGYITKVVEDGIEYREYVFTPMFEALQNVCKEQFKQNKTITLTLNYKIND